VAIALLIQVLRVILYYLIKAFVKVTKGKYLGKKLIGLLKSGKLTPKLTDLFALYLEPIIEWNIASYLSLKAGLKSPAGEFISYCIGLISAIVILMVIPMSMGYIITSDEKKLRTKKMKN